MRPSVASRAAEMTRNMASSKRRGARNVNRGRISVKGNAV
jgi:hypothetical protein